MSSGQHHVVFGAGQVGRALAARLAEGEDPVRVVSLHEPSGRPAGVEWRAADVSDPAAATEAAAGAAVIYQCLNAPYTNWPALFPPLQRGVLDAAERTGAWGAITPPRTRSSERSRPSAAAPSPTKSLSPA